MISCGFDRAGGVKFRASPWIIMGLTPTIDRRNKGMGGTVREDRDWLSNLLALDPVVHNGGPQSVHGRRAWSERRGYLIPKNIPWASAVPVLIFGRFLFMLGDDGQYYPPPPGLGIPPVTNQFD